MALGEAYQALHQPRKALRAYRRSAELDNTHVEAFLGIGATCEALDEVDYALAAYERAVDADPRGTAARLLRRALQSSVSTASR